MNEDVYTTTEKTTVGLPVAITLVMGSIVGSGIFGMPSAMAKYGPLSLVAFAIVTFGAICLAWTFSILSKRHTRSGGEYIFAQEAFGNFAGFLTAWCAWISSWVASAAVVSALVGYVEVFVNKNHSHLGSIVIGLLALWLPALIVLSGIQNMSKAQVLFSVLKYAPILILAIFGIFNMKFANFGSFNPSGEGTFEALMGASSICIYSYLGVEAVSAAAGRVRDPKKNVPKATMWGILFTAALYFLAIVGVMGTVPHNQLVKSTSPFADSANNIFGGQWAGEFIAVVAVLSCFGLLVGWTLVTAEVPAAAAMDKVFPQSFARMNSKNIPAFGVIISTVLASILLVFSYTQFQQVFLTMVLFAVVCTVLPYIFTACAQLYWYVKQAANGTKGPGYGKNLTIVCIAILFAFWAVIGAGEEAVYFGAICMLVGIPIYAYMHKNIRDDETIQDQR
ncbi:MAG: amino acid permease [Micrococcaceae bacterium]